MIKALVILESLQTDVKKDIEAEGIEVFGYIDTAIDEAIAELKALENRSCQNCKKVLFCKIADDTKNNFGFKLKEMCFNCWESK